MHHPADDMAGVITGAALGLAYRLTEVVSAGTYAGEFAHTMVFGVLGGAAGFLGKRAIEHLLHRLQRKNRNNQSDQ